MNHIKTKENVNVNLTISMTLNISELNNLIKVRDCQIRKYGKDPIYYILSTKVHFRFRDANRLTVKGLKKIIMEIVNICANVTIPPSGKIHFTKTKFTRV